MGFKDYPITHAFTTLFDLAIFKGDSEGRLTLNTTEFHEMHPLCDMVVVRTLGGRDYAMSKEKYVELLNATISDLKKHRDKFT